MADAGVRVGASSRGADLHRIARELLAMDSGKVNGIFRGHLEEAARPFPARVRQSALAIPVKPDGKHTGLRARIGLCAELSSLTRGRNVYVRVWINPERIRPDYMTLPLYMEGATGTRRRDYTRWRHPVFGNRDVWVQQPAHPYFYQAVRPLGPASEIAMREALDEVTRDLNG
jgi:hypothetical protein